MINLCVCECMNFVLNGYCVDRQVTLNLWIMLVQLNYNATIVIHDYIAINITDNMIYNPTEKEKTRNPGVTRQ